MLIMMDFFSASTEKQEIVERSNSVLILDKLSFVLTYTESNNFGHISPDTTNIIDHQPINLSITPIFGKVKTYSALDSEDENHISLSGLAGQVILPFIIIMTGLLGIRSSRIPWVILIIVEGFVLISYLLFM